MILMETLSMKMIKRRKRIMCKSRFKEFMLGYFERSESAINAWLADNPNIKIVKWSATPTGEHQSTRLIVEYIPDFYSNNPKLQYDDRDLEDIVEVLD